MQAYASKHGVDDMVMLSKISNDGINDNLKKRHEKDIIYVSMIFRCSVSFVRTVFSTVPEAAHTLNAAVEPLCVQKTIFIVLIHLVY